jgi:predicted transcriptional regulator
MDLQAEKLELIQAIIDIEDISLIRKIQRLISKETMTDDWFDELTIEQQQSIDRGLAEADRGEFIPHEEAMKRLGL